MRHIFLLLSFLSFGIMATVAAADEKAPEVVPRVQMGAYLLRLSNVSQKDGTFEVDMWVWFRWKDKSLKPYESFEFANGKIESRSNPEVTEDEGYQYTSVRVQGTVFHQFDVRRFPLDNHLLTIEFEDENLDVSKFEYEVDQGVAMDPSLSVGGWTATLARPSVARHIYPTSYGLRSSGDKASSYSRFILPIKLERTSYSMLLKQFWISFLAVVLGLLALRVKATDLDARFGLGVGSIFAASANAYTISESLPITTVITLAEQLNFLAIGTIFFTVFLSIASLRLCYAGKDEAADRQDLLAFWVVGCMYLLANLWIVWKMVA